MSYKRWNVKIRSIETSKIKVIETVYARNRSCARAAGLEKALNRFGYAFYKDIEACETSLSKEQKEKGTVRWFDRSSGVGAIRSADGQTYRVHACNIIGAKTMFEHTACMYLEQNQEVEFQPVDGCGACYVSNGIFDSEHWDRIKDKDLAFRLDEKGQCISGLFSNKKAGA